MLTKEIELHDSRVYALVEVGNQIVVFLEVYIHQSEGRPGCDAGSGYGQAAALTFSAATMEGKLPEFPCDIEHGELEVNGTVTSNMFPIPFSEAGKIALSLEFIFPAAEPIFIKGDKVQLTLIGDPVYIEEFPGSDALAQICE